MIAWIEKAVEKSLKKRIDACGLAIFRVLYTSVLLGEVVQLFRFRHLIYDKLPFFQNSEADPTVPILIWIIALLFLILGYHTRIAAVANYLFTLVFFSATDIYEYHMFYAYTGVNFFFMFMPISATGSLDRIRHRLQSPGAEADGAVRKRSTIPVLNYYVLVVLGIGFVYADSVCYKLMSDLWMKGLGVWLPASLPMAVINDYTTLLNQKGLMLFLGYLTFVFETAFIFLFWFRRFRVPLLVIGVGLHLGILFVYPIPWFALGCVSIYILLVPVAWWRKLAAWLRFKHPRAVAYYDPTWQMSNKVRMAGESLDFLGLVKWERIVADGPADKRLPRIYRFLRWLGVDTQHGQASSLRVTTEVTSAPVTDYSRFHIRMAALGFVFLFILQIITAYDSPLVKWITQQLNISKSYPVVAATQFSKRIQKPSQMFLGITKHTVFLDQHFRGYNHIIAVQHLGKDSVFLPMIDEHGNPGPYIKGPLWVNWTFRVNAPMIDPARLYSGIRDYTAFWLDEHNMEFSGQRFRILVKKVDVPTDWEPDFLAKQLQHPWQVAGTVEWSDGAFQAEIADIESL